jgi:hypothetical protein
VRNPLPFCRCTPTHRGRPVDVAALNAPALAALPSLRGSAGEAACLIVPGYTPRLAALRGPEGSLHRKAAARCAAAADDLARGVAPLAIVSGGAVHGPDSEAVLMREALRARGVAEQRILVEPCARHTTTNLRNAGRIMLALGLPDALVVTSDAPWIDRRGGRFVEQAYYLGWPRLSTFHWRCRLTLGYTVGELDWVRPGHVRFVPSPACSLDSPRPTAEGDP